MWKKDEALRPPVRPAQPSVSGPAGYANDSPSPRADLPSHEERDRVKVGGTSVIIKGEITGNEDLTIEGQVDGKIELRQHILTIGRSAKIKAHVFAKAVVIQGEVHGNVTATEKVDIRDAGSVDGDVSAPRVAIADGAHFRGSIDMQRQAAPKPGEKAAGAEVKPAGLSPAVSGNPNTLPIL
jgi:cytoskeletal protein CcmA (bactofilin family)